MPSEKYLYKSANTKCNYAENVIIFIISNILGKFVNNFLTNIHQSSLYTKVRDK